MRTLSARIEFAVVVIGAFGYFILGNILTLLDPSPGPPLSDAGLRSLVVYEGVVLAAWFGRRGGENYAIKFRKGGPMGWAEDATHDVAELKTKP